MEKKELFMLVVSLIVLLLVIGIVLYYTGRLNISRMPLLIAMKWLE